MNNVNVISCFQKFSQTVSQSRFVLLCTKLYAYLIDWHFWSINFRKVLFFFFYNRKVLLLFQTWINEKENPQNPRIQIPPRIPQNPYKNEKENPPHNNFFSSISTNSRFLNYQHLYLIKEHRSHTIEGKLLILPHLN